MTTEIKKKNKEFEDLVESLNDEAKLSDYKAIYDDYKVGVLPAVLGWLLVTCGNLVYGKDPSYKKFRAVEVIARVPYQSWASAAYTLLTMFYTDESKALELSSTTRFARKANDNETMHVVVISHIVQTEHKKISWIIHTLIPMCFAFFYFWASYFLFLINKRWSYELNYLFESHAFAQYSTFLHKYGDRLKDKPIQSDFLAWYGRTPANQYEFFRSVRNDEIIHRNKSIEEIDMIRRNKNLNLTSNHASLENN